MPKVKRKAWFSPQCASHNLHAQWFCTPDAHIIHGSRVQKKVKEKLWSLSGHKDVSQMRSQVRFCEDCIDEVKRRFPEDVGKTDSAVDVEPQQGSSLGDHTNAKTNILHDAKVAEFIELIPKMSRGERAQCAFHLAKIEGKEVTSDSQRLSDCRSIDDILDMLRLHSFAAARNRTVVAFLCGLANQDFPAFESKTHQTTTSTTDQSKLYHLCKTVESIMHYVNPACILPIHFHESTLLYSTVGSKMALQITSIGSPHASYQTVRRWLNSLAGEETHCPKGDFIIVFDNNQVFQRRWRVQLNNAFKVNIVTIVAIFTINEKGNLSMKAELKPSKWLCKELTADDIERVKHVDQTPQVKNTHAAYLSRYIAERLDDVVAQQQWVDGKWKDEIDDKVLEEKRRTSFKICHACGLDDIARNKRNCPGCNSNLKQAEMSHLGVDVHGTYTERPEVERASTSAESRALLETETSGVRLTSERIQEARHKEYSKYTECYTTANCPVSVQTPVFVNPCSYDAVATVLVAVGEKAGIKQYGTGEKEWAPVVCDGLPYGLARRLLLCTFRCSHCSALVYGQEQYETHIKSDHSLACSTVVPRKEFEWVLLMPGPGHIEMNMVKSFVDLTWDIFWREMVILFNFKSPNALKCAKIVTDHHKAWTLCRIAREAITDELLLPFVRSVLSTPCTTVDISPAHFFKYVMNSRNPNYSFMADCIFELLDSIFIYRTGVRSGNLEFIDAGRAKFAKVWFGRVHPLYRELEVSDSLMREKMPPELMEYVTNILSLNTSGVPYTAEGADFKLEAVNKQVQRLIPNVPTGKDWLIACASHDKIMTMRKHLFEAAGILDPADRTTVKKMQETTEEVLAFRTLLRSKGYLSCPDADIPHTSLSGERLADNLKYFCTNARDIRSRYIDFILEFETDAQLREPKRAYFKEPKICITEDERINASAIHSKTIVEIKATIVSDIGNIQDKEMQDAFLAVYYEDIKQRAVKSDCLEFYEEIALYLAQEDASPSEGDIGSDGVQDSIVD